MKKGFLTYFLFICMLCFSLFAFADKKTEDSPVITLINGLSVTSLPGSITITNASGKDIPVTSMLLSFIVDQDAIPGLWGSPWLNWIPAPKTVSLKKLTPTNYQFINQANLPNNTFAMGSSITVQYSPSPWNSTAAPSSVQLYNVTYPLGPASITSSVAISGTTTTITIINTSSNTLSLAGAQLRMSYQGQIYSSIWGSPWANWSVGSPAPNYVLNAGASPQIVPNGALTISFQGDVSPIANISLWVKNSGSPSPQGNITLQLPATPPGATVNPSVTFTGPSYPQGLTVVGTWGQMLSQSNLQIGTYTLSAPEIQTDTQIFLPTFTPNPVVISGSTPVSVNLMYSVKELAKLFIQMPSAPGLGAAAPVITVQGPDLPNATPFTTSWNNTLQICANGASSCGGLQEGNYTVNVPNVYSNTDAFVPTGITNPVVISKNQTTTLPIVYAPVPQASFSVVINPPALKKSKKLRDQTFDVTFTNLEGHVFTKTLLLGNNAVSLPINDTYNITAPNVSGQIATVTPSILAVTETGTPPVTIQYKAGAPTQFVVYYGGWGGDGFDLNTRLPANVTAVNLSFANITSNLQVDTSVSGWLTNIPAPNIRMQPTYVNWTVYKNNHPHTKILLAIGGSTFSAIWNSILTPSTADTMAKNIAEVVNRGYPVYKSDYSYPQDLIGNVYIDGVDLDVETGGRLSATVSNNVALLTQNLKKYLNPGKLITFAAFSVGADPNNSQCTVPGSIHCGEDIDLLKAVGTTFDWINLMAYDAGQDYATSLYKVALANYALYLPKSKILLGLDVQQQWPGFTESAAQLAAKALWQKQNGYAGAMFWGVGVENNPPKEQQYVDAISAALN